MTTFKALLASLLTRPVRRGASRSRTQRASTMLTLPMVSALRASVAFVFGQAAGSKVAVPSRSRTHRKVHSTTRIEVPDLQQAAGADSELPRREGLSTGRPQRERSSISRTHRLSTLLSLQGRRGSSRSPACALQGVPFRVCTQPAWRALHASGRGQRYAKAIVGLTVLGALVGASPACAETPSPWWHLSATTSPTYLQPGKEGEIVVAASNLGDAAANPATQLLTLKDALPPGLTAVTIRGTVDESISAFGTNAFLLECSLAKLSCTFNGKTGPPGEWENAGSPYPLTVPPYYEIQMRITVDVKEGAQAAKSGEEDVASITGGGAPATTASAPITVSDAPVPFGVSSYEMRPEGAGGGVDTQAGSHPFQLTTGATVSDGTIGHPVALVKDLHFKLPPGLIGNPTPFAQCTLTQFLARGLVPGVNPNDGIEGPECSAQTVVGVARVHIRLHLGGTFHVIPFTQPLYNLEPAAGEPARFGFVAHEGEVPVLLTTAVRSGGDYGVTVNVANIPETTEFLSSEVTFWGVPGDSRHDESRGENCLGTTYYTGAGVSPGLGFTCPAFEASHPPPLLSLPTSCTGPLHTTLEADSWLEPHAVASTSSTEPLPALDGCNRLAFAPEIKVSPDAQQSSKPTGLTVDVHVPQEGQLNPTGLADSNIRDIVVTLPEGVTLNPSAADGLQGCSESQVGYLPGASHPPGELDFTPSLPEPLQQGSNFCPDAAKVGTVKISTPLLPKGQPLEGAVYLASPQNLAGPPQENPFSSLVAMYIVARDPVSGVLVKLPGSVPLNQSTGQISATFENTPQLAFEDAEIRFFGGERAPLASPAHCGSYTTEATFTPWSANPPVHSTASFNITSGPNGAPCPGTLPFSPSLTSGSPNINAGAFSPLTTTLGREDGNQNIQNVTLRYPPGMSGILAGIPLCPEAQANAGTCPEGSQIGETIVSVGLGGDPFTVTGGKVYLTEHYEGAPFGLSIVNPAKAGPFNLQEGKPVVVRAKIEIDPYTAALTITTGNIPHIIDGFPLQIKHVNVTINRPGFTFNPTNCNPMSITGTIGSTEGGSSTVSLPFQVANCATLKFEPKVSVSSAAKTSKANGASLFFKISYPKGAQGSESWVNEAKFDIPKQLPVRLTTIQKACLAKVFESNPAACPPGSLIGHAVVHTPVLPVPLTGPVYFVSYGGAKFPSAVLVLQGDGVTVDLVGSTFINGKTGVTSATFANTPDVPFESIEVTIPAGPASEFAANLPTKAKGSLCGQKLLMPTRFKAQNGLEITQSTPIGVTGCPKALTTKQKLAAALKACHKDKKKGKRKACEAAARKKYATKASKTKKKK